LTRAVTSRAHDEEIHAVPASLLLLSLSLGLITYHVDARAALGDNLSARFDPTQLVVLQKLNRADLKHLDRLQVVVVPDTWIDDELAYSPLPRIYSAAAAHPRLVVVHVGGQAFGAYEYGQLVHWGPVSTGTRASPTPAGMYSFNWRKKTHTSTIDSSWIMRWTFNFDNVDGLAFHEQDLPGRPASHGCIRLLGADAEWLFRWATPWRLNAQGTRVVLPGTPVFITGTYDFDAPAPWLTTDRLHEPLAIPGM
jgi:hypothetical protein